MIWDWEHFLQMIFVFVKLHCLFCEGNKWACHYLFSEDNFRKCGLDQFLSFQAEVPAARDCEVHPAQGGLHFHPHNLYL